MVNHHTEAKDIWDIVKLLIEGSEISLQKRESRLYDEFDMFTSVHGETIHTYYLRNRGTSTKVIRCYNCQEKCHVSRQCTKPKRPRNSTCFKEKAMLAEALELGVALDEEQMAFLVDNGDTVTLGQAYQELVNTAAFQTNDLDAFDSDCDEVPSANVVLMAKLSAYDSEVLSE
ncbi:integrase, catalytic region, zinc finger, CCHC-type containing protein, partial [Tanacetum coccineum]